jgi:hypothetical protein
MEKTKAFGLATQHAFIDFKCACDVINIEQMCLAMEGLNIPNKICQIIVRMQPDVTFAVRNNGLRQESAIACQLFIKALERSSAEQCQGYQ